MEHFRALELSKVVVLKDGCTKAQLTVIRKLAASVGIELTIAQTESVGGRFKFKILNTRESVDADGLCALRCGLLAFNPNIARSISSDLSEIGGNAEKDLTVICVDQEELAEVDSGVTIIQRPLKVTGMIAAEAVLFQVGKNQCFKSILRVKPHISYGGRVS